MKQGRRVKTEGDCLAAEVERQRSIFKNLSWQNKQRQKKIDFLERYYTELQQVISKQREKDSELLSRAEKFIKRRKQCVYRSMAPKPLQNSMLNQRAALYLSCEKENEQESRNDFLRAETQKVISHPSLLKYAKNVQQAEDIGLSPSEKYGEIDCCMFHIGLCYRKGSEQLVSGIDKINMIKGKLIE